MSNQNQPPDAVDAAEAIREQFEKEFPANKYLIVSTSIGTPRASYPTIRVNVETEGGKHLLSLDLREKDNSLHESLWFAGAWIVITVTGPLYFLAQEETAATEQPKSRLTLEFQEQSANRLTEMKTQLGLGSIVEVIRHAVKVLGYLLTQQKDGWEIVFRKDGKEKSLETPNRLT